MNEELNTDLMPVDPVRIAMYTHHLTPIAMGVYWRLLCHQWMHGNVPESASVRERIAKGCRKVWPELVSLFEPYDGQLRAPWLAEARAKSTARREELQRRLQPAGVCARCRAPIDAVRVFCPVCFDLENRRRDGGDAGMPASPDGEVAP